MSSNPVIKEFQTKAIELNHLGDPKLFEMFEIPPKFKVLLGETPAYLNVVKEAVKIKFQSSPFDKIVSLAEKSCGLLRPTSMCSSSRV